MRFFFAFGGMVCDFRIIGVTATLRNAISGLYDTIPSMMSYPRSRSASGRSGHGVAGATLPRPDRMKSPEPAMRRLRRIHRSQPAIEVGDRFAFHRDELTHARCNRILLTRVLGIDGAPTAQFVGVVDPPVDALGEHGRVLGFEQ